MVTVTRKSRMQGLPPIRSGLTVIRSNAKCAIVRDPRDDVASSIRCCGRRSASDVGSLQLTLWGGDQRVDIHDPDHDIADDDASTTLLDPLPRSCRILITGHPQGLPPTPAVLTGDLRSAPPDIPTSVSVGRMSRCTYAGSSSTTRRWRTAADLNPVVVIHLVGRLPTGLGTRVAQRSSRSSSRP